MDTCIALRTLVLKGKTAYIQAGAGIVYDSVPADEYEETVNKARGLLKAIEIAETQLGQAVNAGRQRQDEAEEDRDEENLRSFLDLHLLCALLTSHCSHLRRKL